jgi:hypothetical protein
MNDYSSVNPKRLSYARNEATDAVEIVRTGVDFRTQNADLISPVVGHNKGDALTVRSGAQLARQRKDIRPVLEVHTHTTRSS